MANMYHQGTSKLPACDATPCSNKMNQPSYKAHTPAYERTRGCVCVTCAFNVCDPFDTTVEWISVTPNLGIGDVLAERDFCLFDGMELEVVLNGVPLTLAQADAVILKNDDVLIARIIPAGGGGGGSNPVQIIAMVALVALAVTAPYLAGGAFVKGAVAGELFSGTVTGLGGMLSAGVMVGGSLVMSAVFPPPKLSFGQGLGQNSLEQSSTYSWNAQRNPTAQGGVIPIVQGTVTNITPYQLATYISTDGDKQYFNGLYAVAEGELDDIFDIAIDGNPIENYEHVFVTKRLGSAEQDSIPEFSQVEQESAVGVKLTTAWHTVSLAGTGISRLGIGINAMQGIGYANNKGGLDPITVTVAVEYRQEGASVWQHMATITLQGARRSAMMRYEEYSVARSITPYELRLRIASAPFGDRYISDVYWEYYHEIITDDFHLPHTALFALRALPTESLSGSLPRITCSATRATALLPSSGGEMAARSLANPAYAVLELAYNGRYGVGEPANNIDLRAFELAAQWCEKKALVGGMYIDAAMNFETLAGYWGQLGRFTLERSGTMLTCISDRPQEYPDAAFLVTSADVQQGTFGIDFGNLEDRADGFEITWFDDERGKQTLFSPSAHFWQQNDRPPRVSTLTLYPCRSEKTARIAASYLNRCNQYLTRVCSFTLGANAIGPHLKNGSVVQVAVDLLLNTESALVVSATEQCVTLNRDIHLEANTGYELVLSHCDHMDARTERELIETLPLVPVSSTTTTRTLELATPFRVVPSKESSCAIGFTNRVVRWYRVISMSYASDMTVKLTCLEYDEAIYADEDAPPALNGAGNWVGIAGVMASIITAVEDGLEKKLISLSWRGYALRWRVFYKRVGVDSTWTLAGSTTSPSFVIRNLEVGYVYRITVTATANPMDGKAIEIDFQLGTASGVVQDVVIDTEPVLVVTEPVQAII